MRLTLRTMLAYLDDILEPNDAQLLEQKIEESKFASDLVHRIRSSTRRFRLSAPKVDGKGLADDANTVAEYLDNVPSMTPETILEFEKVCLESDVHLAEVASAHQILTHVLREPAQIGEALRERVYQIGHGEIPAAAARTAPEQIPAEDSTPENQVRHSPQVDSRVAEPMSLQAAPPVPPMSADERSELAHVPAALGRTSRQPFPLASLAITLLLGFVLAAVALRAMGELGPNHPVLRFLVGGRSSGQVAQVPDQKNQSADSTSQSTAEVDGTAVQTANPDENGKAQEPVQSTDVKKSTSTAAATASSTGSPESSSLPITGEKELVPSLTERPATAPASEPDKAATDTASPDVTTDAATNSVDSSKNDNSTLEPDKSTDVAASATVETPASPVTAGRFLSEEQVIAKWDEGSTAWTVLPADFPLVAGDQLLSLPTFRPQVVVAPSVKLTLAGESLIRINAPDSANVPQVTILWGRATLIPVGDMMSSVVIDVGDRKGLLTFADVESAVAIDVRRYLPVGQDPFASPPHLAVQLWATSASVTWQEQGGVQVQLGPGQRGLFIDKEPLAIASSNLPDWIDGRNLSDIDRRASQELRKFITPDRPLTLSLMELTNYRQIEVRSLACRSLAYLDIYEPALESLGDEHYRAYWYKHLDTVRARIGQGEAPATKVLATVDKLFNEQAELVFRLLSGYSQEQLATGGAKELVDELANSSMTIRVLAFENLRRITGATQLFRPEERPEQEKPRVQKWRKLLDEGQIRYQDRTSE